MFLHQYSPEEVLSTDDQSALIPRLPAGFFADLVDRTLVVLNAAGPDSFQHVLSPLHQISKEACRMKLV